MNKKVHGPGHRATILSWFSMFITISK